MSKEDKLYLLRDRDDYIKKLSDDNVINVIGTKGSGKTSSALKYISDSDYLVINCDNFYDMPVFDGGKLYILPVPPPEADESKEEEQNKVVNF